MVDLEGEEVKEREKEKGNNEQDMETRMMNIVIDDDISKNPPISITSVHLDDELISLEILSRLPVNSLMRFKCVCQHWKSLIESDPHFINLHLTLSKTRLGLLLKEYGKRFLSANLLEGRATVHTTITYNCTEHPMPKPVNGLICFEDLKSASVCIYNLGTRKETKWIKSAVRKELEEETKNGVNTITSPFPTFALGFDPATKEHKVICVSIVYNPKNVSSGPPLIDKYQVCEVLTVGQNSWRRIAEVPPYELRGVVSVSVDGAIYWKKYPRYYGVSPDGHDVIVVFDLGTEKFRVIQIPKFILDQFTFDGFKYHRSYLFDLLEVNGRVALLHGVSGDTTKMWICDEDKGKSTTTVSGSTSSSNNWIEETILFPFGHHCYHCHAIARTDQMIITFYYTNEKYSIYSYDRKNKNFKEIEISGISPFPCNYYLVSTFVESLVPVQQQPHTLSPAGI